MSTLEGEVTQGERLEEIPTLLPSQGIPKLDGTSTSQSTQEFVNRQGHMILGTLGRLQKLYMFSNSILKNV